MSSKVMNLADKLHEKTINILKQLDDVWDEIGLDDETRELRHQMFYEHVENLYNDMLSEAESSKANLLEQIESMGKDLFALRRDLRMDISLEGYENVPLYVAKQEMKIKLQKYQQMFNSRKTEIDNLITHQKMLCQSLGKKPRDLVTTPLPTKEEISEFQTYLEELSDLKFKREEEFLALKTRIIAIMDELKIKPSLDFERKVVICEDSAFKVTDENMEQLRELHKSLENQLQETKIKISELRERISNLWERLEESPQVRSAFLEAHQGNSVGTLIDLKEELHKLEERKKANIKLFVDKLRQELIVWWSKCYYDQTEQEEFIHFHSDCYTEDLLTLHEIQVEKVKDFYEKNIAIFNMYNKRHQLWEKMLDLEHRANQPNRFKNRGGQLLNEEKERKTISAQLPKIENELLELVKEYELSNGKPFLIYGKSIEHILNEAWKEHKEDKKLKLSVKKKLREQATPGKSFLPTPTISKSSHATSTMSSCSKRKLFTPLSEASKRSRIEESTTKSSSKPPSSTKAKSIDRQRRLEKIKKREHAQKINDTNYELFENGLETKSSCRSSLTPGRLLRSKTLQVPSIIIGTPRKALVNVNNINKTPQRTPLRPGLRPKSPTHATPRLTAAPSNLPIII